MKTYSVKQIAEMLSTNPETVRRWIRDKKLKAVQVSRKSGNVVTEVELERFIKATPKYMAKISASAGLFALSPIAGIGLLAGGIVTSAILGNCGEKTKVDFRIRVDDFKEYLEEQVIKLKRMVDQKQELIKQTETEIEELSKRIDQYNYMLEHEDILVDTLVSATNKKKDGQNE